MGGWEETGEMRWEFEGMGGKERELGWMDIYTSFMLGSRAGQNGTICFPALVNCHRIPSEIRADMEENRVGLGMMVHYGCP